MATSDQDQSDWRHHITGTPDVLRGKARIEGTRIPVALILGYLASGAGTEEIISEFPDLRAVRQKRCQEPNIDMWTADRVGLETAIRPRGRPKKRIIGS